MIDKLWLATLTRNDDDAGTPELTLNVTINIDGRDVLDWDFGFLGGSGVLSGGLGPESGWLERGQAAIAGGKYGDPGETLPDPIETNLLTNSSIRLGIRDDQAWAPSTYCCSAKRLTPIDRGSSRLPWKPSSRVGSAPIARTATPPNSRCLSALWVRAVRRPSFEKCCCWCTRSKAAPPMIASG